MRKRVHDYINNCITCLTVDEAPNRLEHETFLSDPPKTPMEIVHADHFDPLQQTKLNYKYILVIIDAFTRFVWLYATKTTSSRETIKNL